METGVRKAFSERLRACMLEKGYKAKRGARHGVDVGPLKEIAGLRTLEMARRYVTGESLPDPERLAKIAGWLGLSITWLRDGVGQKYAASSPPAANADSSEERMRDTLKRLSPVQKEKFLYVLEHVANANEEIVNKYLDTTQRYIDGESQTNKREKQDDKKP